MLMVAACGREELGEPATDPCDIVRSYADADGDGHGDPAAPVDDCEPPADHVAVGDDCDDGNPSASPGAVEHCDGVDEDCDGLVDDEAVDVREWFADGDGDGYGTTSVGIGCEPDGSAATEPGDCDDADPAMFPGAPDPLDGIDSDCDWAEEIAEAVEVTALGPYAPWLEQWQQPVTGPAAVRMFGVYEATDGAITVDVRTSQPTILVLAGSYVRWTVSEAVPGTVQEIRLSGYGEVEAAPEGVPVGWLAQGLIFDTLDDPTRFYLEGLLGKEVTSFHAVYETSGFVIEPAYTIPPYPEWPECDAYTPTTFAATAPDTTAPRAACPTETEESAWCVAVGNADNLVVLGLDSFSTCDLGLYFNPHSAGNRVASIAWVGGDVFGCVGQYGILERVQLDGSEAVDHAYHWCADVASDGGELLAIPWSPAATAPDALAFASWEDAQCGPSSGSAQVGWGRDEVHGAADGVGWSAWHAGSRVSKYDLAGGTGLLGDITLQDYDGWIKGLGPVGDRLVVSTHEGVRIHDASTGAYVDGGATTERLYGLACVQNR